MPPNFKILLKKGKIYIRRGGLDQNPQRKKNKWKNARANNNRLNLQLGKPIKTNNGLCDKNKFFNAIHVYELPIPLTLFQYNKLG